MYNVLLYFQAAQIYAQDRFVQTFIVVRTNRDSPNKIFHNLYEAFLLNLLVLDSLPRCLHIGYFLAGEAISEDCGQTVLFTPLKFLLEIDATKRINRVFE